MKKFEVGKFYTCSWNYGDGVYAYKCIKRTDKTVWFEDNKKETKKALIKANKDEEVCYPFGGIITAGIQLPVSQLS